MSPVLQKTFKMSNQYYKTYMTDLTTRKCVPCEGGVKPFTQEEINMYLKELPTGWEVLNDVKIKKNFKFVNFRAGMDFVNKVAEVANAENHHPDICIHYANVEIEIFTHAINGLSENDFILAAKIEAGM